MKRTRPQPTSSSSAAAASTKEAESLQEADRIAEEQYVVPTNGEKSAISTYCTLSLQCKKTEAAAREAVKNYKPQIKELRTTLMEELKKQNCDLYQIPQHIRKDIDRHLVSMGLPPIPPYIRIVRNNKDLTITSEIVSDVINSLSQEDVLEAKASDGVEAFVEAVMNAVRRNVRSYTEQIKLMESVPRTVRAADVPIADDDLSQQAVELHEATSRVLQTERQKREALAQAKTQMVTHASTVDGFFVRGNMTHQRVVLEGTPYNLCRRVTVIKPKVTFKVLGDILHDGVKEALLASLRGGGGRRAAATQPPSKADLVGALQGPSKEELVRLVTLKMTGLPSTSKTLIHLQRVKVSTDEGDDE